jgi:hypothetical protein
MEDSVTDHNALLIIVFKTQTTQMVERQARDLEVRGSNYGPGLNFYLEI